MRRMRYVLLAAVAAIAWAMAASPAQAQQQRAPDVPRITLDEAKKAFRRKAKATHPDSGGTPDDFRRVTEAFAAATRHFGGEA